MKTPPEKTMCLSWTAFFNCMAFIKKKSKKIDPIRVTQDQHLKSKSSDIPTTPQALVNVDFGEIPSEKVETPPSMNTQTASDTSLETPPLSLGDHSHKSGAVVAPILPGPEQHASTLDVVSSPRKKERPPHIDPTSHRINTLYELPTAKPEYLYRPKEKPEIVSDEVIFLGCYYERKYR